MLADLDTMRLDGMDVAGIELFILSLTAPGIQAETDPRRAVTLAKMGLRFSGGGRAAADKLQRCADDLEYPGVMLSGSTNFGDARTGWYYDHERFLLFWERAKALPIPVDLHPGDPLPRTRASTKGIRSCSARSGALPSRPPPTLCG